ncbi:thioredoxin family protein [Bacteroidota bacterium]
MHRFTYLPLVAICLLLFSSKTFSQEATSVQPASSAKKIKWMSFEQAYELNKKHPKKIFIDMYTDWCGWCKRMDATTFSDPVIADYMNKNFYNVKMDAERKDTVVIDGNTFVNPNPTGKRSSHQLAIELLRGKMSYPSFIFLNEKSQLLTVVPGYQQAKDFEPILHYFGEDAFTDQQWEEYRAKFKGKIE